MSTLEVALDLVPLVGHPTGVGRFCAGLLAGLVSDEGEVAVRGYGVSRVSRADLEASARRATGDAAPVPIRVARVPARAANRWWAKSDLPPIEWLTGRVDVVHGTNFVVPPSRGAGRVVTVHDLAAVRYPELCAPASLAYPGLVERAVRQGAHVHVPSEVVKIEVVELLGATPARVKVVPHGIAPHRSTSGGSRRERPYLLFLGTLEPRKDLPTLVAAFGEVAAAQADLELVVAGSDGWASEAFAGAVARLDPKARARVVRLDYVTELERCSLLEGCEVLVYPSIYEGFGFPPLEAMAAGVPVVATAAGAVPEVVGTAAELVPPRDAVALAGAICRVLSPARRSELIAAGEERVARFTWSACAAGLYRLYLDAAADRGITKK